MSILSELVILASCRRNCSKTRNR